VSIQVQATLATLNDLTEVYRQRLGISAEDALGHAISAVVGMGTNLDYISGALAARGSDVALATSAVKSAGVPALVTEEEV
jgi:hypothetical protein